MYEQELQEWELAPGFCSALLRLYASPPAQFGVPERLLAVLCLKNAVARRWQHRGVDEGSGGLADSEKAAVRSRAARGARRARGTAGGSTAARAGTGGAPGWPGRVARAHAIATACSGAHGTTRRGARYLRAVPRGENAGVAPAARPPQAIHCSRGRAEPASAAAPRSPPWPAAGHPLPLSARGRRVALRRRRQRRRRRTSGRGGGGARAVQARPPAPIGGVGAASRQRGGVRAAPGVRWAASCGPGSLT